MKICSVPAELFIRKDRLTNRERRFLQFCERVQKFRTCIPRVISFRGTLRLRQLQTGSSIQIISTQSPGFISCLEILFYLNFDRNFSLSIKLLGLVLVVAFSPSHCLFALSLTFHRPQL